MRLSLALLASALLVSATAAAEPPSLADNVRQAVRDRRVVDTENLGDRAARAAYREVVQDGAVLAGLEVGLAQFGAAEVPFAFRPIYRDGDHDFPGTPAGNMRSRQIRRTVKVVAQPGYVVGGLWVRSGGGLDRLCLHFFRARDGGLDPADHYASEWVGTSDGGAERYLGGSGRPIVGLFADAPDEQARAFGLTFARVPPAGPKKADAPAPAADPADAAAAKTRLEQEAEERRQREQELQQLVADDGTGLLVFLVPVGLLAVPAAGVGLFLLAGGANPRRGRHAGRADRSPRNVDGQPVDERPELARRLEPYLPAGRGRKRPPLPKPRPGTTPRPEAEIPKPVVAEAKPVTALPTPPPDDAPLFFLARATYKARHMRMARIYVLENEMLIIDAGAGADVNEVAGVTAAVLTGGGVIGAMVGGAVGAMVADGQKAKGEAFQKKLDQLDLAGLMVWAEQAGNFRAKFADVVGLSIDPPPARSFWKGNQTRAVGTFRFRHLQRGEFTFEFLIGAEIRGAIELIRRSAGGASLHVGNGWDEATAAYLVGLV